MPRMMMMQKMMHRCCCRHQSCKHWMTNMILKLEYETRMESVFQYQVCHDIRVLTVKLHPLLLLQHVIPWSKFEFQFESTHKWSTTLCTEESPHLRVSTEDFLKRISVAQNWKSNSRDPKKRLMKDKGSTPGSTGALEMGSIQQKDY